MAKQTFVTGQVLSAAQVTALQTNDYNKTVNTKTASYVLVASDVGTRIVMNAAGATNITVNTSLFAAGDTLEILNIGAGVCTILAGTATVSTVGSLALNQFDGGELYFTSAAVSIFNGVGDIGDITGVTAGNGLSGGGNSGAVSLAIDTAITVDLTTSQNLTNKNLSDTTTFFRAVADVTKRITLLLSGMTTGILGTLAFTFTTAKTITFPDTTGTVALTSDVINPTIVDAAGDLIIGTADNTVGRLAIGTALQQFRTNAGATAPEWFTPAAASTGKTSNNKILNGDFFINQRAFTSNTADGAYNFDRFLQKNTGGTTTVTPVVFSLGTAPVVGQEGRNHLRCVTASQSAAGDFARHSQRIEDVRTFANQAVVVSFYAKANTGTPKVGIQLVQNFGTGGSPSAEVSAPISAITLSTSWQRFEVTITVPDSS